MHRKHQMLCPNYLIMWPVSVFVCDTCTAMHSGRYAPTFQGHLLLPSLKHLIAVSLTFSLTNGWLHPVNAPYSLVSKLWWRFFYLDVSKLHSSASRPTHWQDHWVVTSLWRWGSTDLRNFGSTALVKSVVAAAAAAAAATVVVVVVAILIAVVAMVEWVPGLYAHQLRLFAPVHRQVVSTF
jgi:type III secretory pathway component EscS